MIYLEFFPEESRDYVHNLRLEHICFLKSVKPRKSKLGDFKVRGHQTSISINGDLSKDEYLFVFLHEMAHFITYKKHANKVLPHGVEWQYEFSILLKEALLYFNKSYQEEILNFSKNPTASLSPRSKLRQLFSSQFKPLKKQGSGITLDSLEIGAYFILNKKVFKKEKLLRTRYLCRREVDFKLFTIQKTAEIEPYEK